MSYDTNPAAVGALILVPIVIAIGGAFGAVKLSEVGGVWWTQLQRWRRHKFTVWERQGHKRNRSDETGDHSSEASWDLALAQESGRANWNQG